MMTAQGSAGPDARIEFGGTSWRVESLFCGTAPWNYNIDRFSGAIDATLQEFQSVDNDGGRAVNDPTVFRRVRCFEPPPVPHVAVAPPPFHPPQRAGGCSRQ